MNTGNTYKHEDKSRAAAIRKKQKEQRRIMCILLAIVLIIFSLGTVFGCFLVSGFASDTANAKETAQVADPVAEQKQVAEPVAEQKQVATTLLHIESEGNILDKELQETMLAMCEKYEIPFALALAVAEQESHFNPEAVSHTNDYGIMQINSINFEWLQKKGINPLDPKENIEAGVLMLSDAIARHGEIELALMAYNCGDAGAKRLWKQGIYSTKYSSSVMKRYNKWTDYIRGV